jgi:hypothetical protein
MAGSYFTLATGGVGNILNLPYHHVLKLSSFVNIPSQSSKDTLWNNCLHHHKSTILEHSEE